jgi:hypothetical protein
MYGHHMSISVDADIRQLQVLCRHACLLQELDCSPVIRRMVRGLGCHDQNWHMGEVYKLSRRGGIGLDNAVGVQGRVGRNQLLHEIRDRIGHSRQEGEGAIGKP